VRITLDTNRLTDLLQGDGKLAEFLSTCEEVWVPLIVLAEIKAGFQGGTQRREMTRFCRVFWLNLRWTPCCKIARPRNITPGSSRNSSARVRPCRITICG